MCVIVTSLLMLVSVAATARADATLEALGPGARELSPGHYEVTLADGTTLTTHGPDPDDIAEDHGTGIGPGDPERDPLCATDYYQYVLYGRLSSSTNRYSTKLGEIRSSMKRVNAVLDEEARSSGGIPANYKVRCDGDGQITVGSFTSSATDYSSIVNGARNAGYTASNADYTIFFDGDRSGVCGTANFTQDESSGANNANNSGGDYAVVYLSCWNTRTPMHENGHNQGAVQPNAPDSTGTGGHCNDLYDVLCYAPDGGNKNQSEVTRCTDRMHFDCDNDTYFDAAPEPGEWLATHWNIGSSVNRFIRFGANIKPVASFSYSCAQMTCSFTDTSTDQDGVIASRNWTFGDGGTSTAANPTRTYANPGTYTVSLTVFDDLGGTASTNQTIQGLGPPLAPVITSPAQNGSVYGPSVTIAGSAQALSTVRVFEGSLEIATTTATSGGTWSVAPDMSDAQHTVYATAEDADGTGAPSATRTFRVVIDPNPPPAPVIRSPGDGDHTGSSLTVSGDAEPLSTVLVYDGPVMKGSGPASSAGTFAVSITLGDGSHTLTAEARDGAGNTGPRSGPVTIDVDTTAPQVSVDQGSVTVVRPTDGVVLGGTASDRNGVVSVEVEFRNQLGVRVKVVNAVVGPPGANGAQRWTAEPGPLPPDVYTVFIQARDGVGLPSARISRTVVKLDFT
jgi:PKD repeat protein